MTLLLRAADVVNERVLGALGGSGLFPGFCFGRRKNMGCMTVNDLFGSSCGPALGFRESNLGILGFVFVSFGAGAL